MTVVVFGNIALDVICCTVDRVPRYDSIGIDQAMVSAGGCGSNVAVGIRSLGVPVLLGGCIGDDAAGTLITHQWEEMKVDWSLVKVIQGQSTGVSIGLVDSNLQPRFIHMPGASRSLSPSDIDIKSIVASGANWLHIAGFYILPGLENDGLPSKFAELKAAGIKISLDVVRSPQMEHPEVLWPSLPWVDYLFCNEYEAKKISGERSLHGVAMNLLERGANGVVIKLGAKGCCFFERRGSGSCISGKTPGVLVDKIVDTTGAGDAFAAGFLCSKQINSDTETACLSGAKAAGRVIRRLGAVTGWRLPVD